MIIPGVYSRQARRTPPEPPMPSGLGITSVFVAPDASDNGTTFSWKDRISGNIASQTGAGRAVISTEYGHPAIDVTNMTQVLKAQVNLSTRKQCVWYTLVRVNTSVVAGDPESWIYQHGTTADATWGTYQIYGNNVGKFKTYKLAAGGTGMLGTRDLNGGARAFSRVLIGPFDIDASQEVCDSYGDFDLLVTEDYTQVFSTGTFNLADLFIGTKSDGSAPFKGKIMGIVGCNRLHTLGEQNQIRNWLAYFAGTDKMESVAFAGDSLTATPGFPGWRGAAQTAYEADPSLDRWFRQVGRQPTTPTFAQDYCMAIAGQTISGMKTQFQNDMGTAAKNIQKWHPTIIYLMIGTNDIATNGLTGFDTAYGDLLDTIKSLEPNIKCVVVCKIPPRTDNPTAAANIVTANAVNLPNIVAAANGRGIKCMLSDVIATTTPWVTTDGLHQNTATNNLIGPRVYNELVTVVRPFANS